MSHSNNSKSFYRSAADYIYETTGRDCSELDTEQMDRVGMACENGALDFDRGDFTCGDTEAEIIGSYVGAAFDDLRL